MDKESKTRVEAVERLDEAREEQRQRLKQHHGARGSSSELAAQANLHAADDQVAAREAWVKWTEREY
jgi:hypothetical protein